MWSFGVPNVPCGVESASSSVRKARYSSVPNVPCGVERLILFLLSNTDILVPNVPCGVERLMLSKNLFPAGGFLMYRVELKVTLGAKP